jgi:predicted RNase H-related nuclease YkuK (DUF458 family)
MQWVSLSGERVDDISAILRSEVLACPSAEVHVGSDSQQVGKDTVYVTVLTVHRPSKGGRVFFRKQKVPRIKELHDRLWKEVWMSVELAMQLAEPPDGSEPIKVAAVHVDANVDPKFRSSKYVEELAGLVVGQGFNVILKPEAWAASHAADHAVKNKNERRKPLPRRRQKGRSR